MSKTRGLLKSIAAVTGVQYKVVATVCAVLATFVFAYSSYAIYDAMSTQTKAYGDQSIMKYKPEYSDGTLKTSSGNTAELEKAIKDYKGWLTINGTNIDYPVVQGTDDLYYANHDIYGESSLTGAIYMSSLNAEDGTDDYNIIYGHHMSNGAMFGQILLFKDEAFLNTHRTGIWITKKSIYELKCFAVVHTDAYNSNIYNLTNRSESIKDYLRNVSNAEEPEANAEEDKRLLTEVLSFDEEYASLSDKVVALSTCDSDYTNGRALTFWTATAVSEMPTVIPDPVATGVATMSPRPTATPAPTQNAGGSTTPRVTKTPDPTSTPSVKKQSLVIRYVFNDGTEAHKAWVGEFAEGEKYIVRNPSIPGYVTVYPDTSGTMSGRKKELTVIYLPEAMAASGSLSSVDQLEKNANGIHVHMLTGVACE